VSAGCTRWPCGRRLWLVTKNALEACTRNALYKLTPLPLPVNVASRFLRHFRSSISKVSFFVLTKRWVPILLSKFSENCVLLGKWKVNFGVHGLLSLDQFCRFIRSLWPIHTDNADATQLNCRDCGWQHNDVISIVTSRCCAQTTC